MLIDSEDPKLTRPEREALRVIAYRLKGGEHIALRRLDKLPAGYREQAEAHFRGCAEDGDLAERGSVTPPQW